MSSVFGLAELTFLLLAWDTEESREVLLDDGYVNKYFSKFSHVFSFMGSSFGFFVYTQHFGTSDCSTIEMKHLSQFSNFSVL